MKPLKYYLNKYILGRARERRRHLRKPLSLKVTNQKSGFFTYYVSMDISVGGMFLKADEPLSTGTTLDLEFTLPRGREAIRVEAEVVRVTTGSEESGKLSGMGIRFKDLKKEHRLEIESFVNEQA